jgi:hypothetical protein
MFKNKLNFINRMTYAFNPTQRVFALNYLSNLCMGKKGSAQVLQTWMHTTLDHAFADKDFINWMGQWQLVWGPVVVSEGEDVTKQVASNTVFVAYDAVNATYVVAVAGTNPLSTYGWFTEDFMVQEAVAWVYELPDADRISEHQLSELTAKDPVHISRGTYIGLHILRSMKSNGKTIQEFLSDEASKHTRSQQVIVSGHSLGGALSATLALSLENQQPFWDVQRKFTVSAMPSAGATPGNNAFSVYYSKHLGTRTMRIWNVIDPVPHGWEPAMLEKVPFLYAPYLRGSAALGVVWAAMTARSLKVAGYFSPGGLYTQLVPQTAPLPGQVSLQLLTDAGEDALPLVSHLLLSWISGMGKDAFTAFMTRLHIAEAAQKLIFTALKLLSETRWARNHLRQLLDAIRAALSKISVLNNEQLVALEQFFDSIIQELTVIYQFLVQLSYQHCAAYLQLMGIGAFEAFFKSLEDTYKKKPTPPDYEAMLAKYLNVAVFRVIAG